MIIKEGLLFLGNARKTKKIVLWFLALCLAPIGFSPLPLKLIKEPKNLKTQKVSTCYRDRIPIDMNSISDKAEITIINYY